MPARDNGSTSELLGTISHGRPYSAHPDSPAGDMESFDPMSNRAEAPPAPTAPAKPGAIESVFRNGTVTAVGILIGFALNFATQWALNPVPWYLWNVAAVVLLVAGIVLQFVALVRLLDPECLALDR